MPSPFTEDQINAERLCYCLKATSPSGGWILSSPVPQGDSCSGTAILARANPTVTLTWPQQRA